MKKVLSVLMVVLMIVCMSTNVLAVSIDTIESNANKALDGKAANAFNTLGGTIIQYVTAAAMVIAVVMVAILGVKYMMGSVEEKAEYKKSFVPLLVGAVLVFGAATIARIIVGLAGNF